MKVLIILALVYLGYRYLRNWMLKTLEGVQNKGQGEGQADDLMIKDPVCGVYFPQREGVVLRTGGRQLIFCSEKCRDEYLKRGGA